MAKTETTTETKPKAEKPLDLLSFSRSIWNENQGTFAEEISLRDPKTNVLASYDYEPHVMQVGGVDTEFSILRTTDNGLPVGIPFKDTYKVLYNSNFIGIVEDIVRVLAKMGIKWKIATSGTLRNRGRVFISIEMDGLSEFTIGDRVFNAFLNCLNSVDKSCSVTFSNNTFCVCCKNTFAAALQGQDGEFHSKIKHTEGMSDALEDIPLIVEAWISGNERIFGQLKAFNSIGVSLTQAENAYAAFLAGETPDVILKQRSLNMVDRFLELFRRGAGNKGETLLDLFSAVTDYYSHESAGKTEDPWKQIESSEIGDGANRKLAFFSLLNEMADKTDRFTGVCRVGEHVLIASRKAAKEAKVAREAKRK